MLCPAWCGTSPFHRHPPSSDSGSLAYHHIRSQIVANKIIQECAQAHESAEIMYTATPAQALKLSPRTEHTLQPWRLERDAATRKPTRISRKRPVPRASARSSRQRHQSRRAQSLLQFSKAPSAGSSSKGLRRRRRGSNRNRRNARKNIGSGCTCTLGAAGSDRPARIRNESAALIRTAAQGLGQSRAAGSRPEGPSTRGPTCRRHRRRRRRRRQQKQEQEQQRHRP
jgi:hypothetical protein